MFQAKSIDVKKEGLHSLHSTQLVCELLSYTIFCLWCLYRTMYVFMCFYILIALIVPVWKLNYRQAFLNPWPTLHHNVRICMGLLIHKTSLFLAFVDKFLCKNEGGGGGFVPFSMLNLFDIDRGFLLPNCTYQFFRLF